MSYFDEPMRAIACAAKMRDWDTIDAVLEDQRAQGRMTVFNGFADARKRLGLEPPLPALETPEPVTVHDLPSLDGIKIVGGEGETHKWEKMWAA